MFLVGPRAAWAAFAVFLLLPFHATGGQGLILAAEAPADVPAGAAIRFERNDGQFPSHVKFRVHGAGLHAFLTDTGATLVLLEPATDAWDPRDPLAEPVSTARQGWATQLVFSGAPTAGTGIDVQPGITNYFIGNDPAQWHTRVPHFARVVQEDVWPGIDVVWHGDGGLKFDLVVAPGAEPALARFQILGAQVAVEQGRLVMRTPLGDLIKDAPLALQAGREIAATYLVAGGSVGFQVGPYDRTKELVIDPLVYSTYVGGADSIDAAYAIDVGPGGDAFITGLTDGISGDIYPATPGAFQTLPTPVQDAFVTRLSSDGSSLVYSTYLGGVGQGWERGLGIAVDDAGSAVVVGTTKSETFPTTPGALQTSYGGGGYDSFVTKLAPTGAALEWSTYLGGSDFDNLLRVALDAAGEVYLTGGSAADYPVSPGAYQTTAPGPAGNFPVITILTASGTLRASTFLRGGHYGFGIAVNAAGDVIATGYTGPGFPTTLGAAQPAFGGGNTDAWVVALDPTLSTLRFATHLGGTGDEDTRFLALDASGDIYVAGLFYRRPTAASATFPSTPGAFQENFMGGTYDGLVAKLSADGSQWTYVSLLGGSGSDAALGISVNQAGRILVAGETESPDFPVPANALQPTHGGPRRDQFIAILDPTLSVMLNATFLGGMSEDIAYAIASREPCDVWLAGNSRSSDFPTTPGVYQPNLAAPDQVDAVVAKISGLCPGAPQLSFTWNEVCHNTPTTFRLSAVPADPAWPILSAAWRFGDGATRGDAPAVTQFQHTYAAPGTYTVDVEIADLAGTNVTVSDEVRAVNCRPDVAPIDDRHVEGGDEVTVHVQGSDPNRDAVRYEVTGLPPGAVFDEQTLTIRWATPLDAHGRFGPITVRIIDAYGMSDVEVFFITVEGTGAFPPVRSDDADGDGAIDGHDACPAVMGGAVDGCAAGGAVTTRPGPLSCEDLNVTVDAASAWVGADARIVWRVSTTCPIERFLVWNGTSDLLAVIPYDASLAYYTYMDPGAWPDGREYWVQWDAVSAAPRFVAERAVPASLSGADTGANGPGVDDGGTGRAPGAVGSVGRGFTSTWPWWLLVIAAAGALTWRLRHVPWVALFSRLREDALLKQPARSALYEMIVTEPGIHMNEMIRRLGKGKGVVRHHLQVLLKAGVIRRDQRHGYSCFYPRDTDVETAGSGALLRARLARDVLMRVRRHPGETVEEVATALGVTHGAVLYHLHRFRDGGLVSMKKAGRAYEIQALPLAQRALGDA